MNVHPGFDDNASNTNFQKGWFQNTVNFEIFMKSFRVEGRGDPVSAGDP